MGLQTTSGRRGAPASYPVVRPFWSLVGKLGLPDRKRPAAALAEHRLAPGEVMATITVRDETFPGRRAAELTLEFLTERVTVRELIRSRVYQEVTEYNAAR